jgi:hypothetical protein
MVPALFEDLDCSNSEHPALMIDACSGINSIWPFDRKTMQRDTEEGCAFFEQELRRVCQGSLSLQDWVVEIDACSLDDCFHQSTSFSHPLDYCLTILDVSLPLPEPWLHPRQLERQLEALNGYKAPLLIDSLDVHLKWDLAGACRRGLREETSKTKSWGHVVMRQDWPIGSEPLKGSPDQVNQYFQRIAQATFQTREERLCLNGPALPSHTAETDSVPEDLLNSLMDNFEAMPATKGISQGRKLAQRSKSMLDKFLQLRVPVGIVSS